MVANSQMIPFRFNGGIDHLIVEELCALRFAHDAPVIEVDETTEERELILLSKCSDLDEVLELPNEDLHPLFKPSDGGRDLRAHERLHAVAAELALEFG